MKMLYIFLNVFLFFLMVILLMLNLKFKPHAPDKILSAAPDLKKTASAVPAIITERDGIVGVSSLWENNLFSPYRSGDGGNLLGGGGRPVGMELLGVSRLGDIAGAIIIDKTPATSPAAVQPATRIRGIKSGNSAAIAPQTNAPRFWKLGEQMQNGFFLSEVNNDSVVLSRGREQIVLKLDYSSQESLARNASASETAAAAGAKLEAKNAAITPAVTSQPALLKGGRRIPVPFAGPPPPDQPPQDPDRDPAPPAAEKPE